MSEKDSTRKVGGVTEEETKRPKEGGQVPEHH